MPLAFILREPISRWGDYGRILVQGMSRHLPRRDARIQLERAGAFIPPITLPGLGDIVVTDTMRRALAGERFSGISFDDVDLARVVDLDWMSWDQSADRPPFYPANAGPEGYILDRPHDQALAGKLGKLWELVPARWGQSAAVRAKKGIDPPGAVWKRVDLESGDGPMPDFFKTVRGTRFVFVSARAREWLLTQVGQWVRFVDISPAAP